MAHFAKLDSDNVVLSVVTLEDKYCPDDNEEAGRAYLESVHGWPTWKRTSYNTLHGAHKNGGTAFRGNYAGVGFTYDSENDVFIPPKPYASWVLNTSTWDYDPPIAYPTDGNPVQGWDEDAYQADTNDPKTAGWIRTT
jgi:hypothetical protein